MTISQVAYLTLLKSYCLPKTCVSLYIGYLPTLEFRVMDYYILQKPYPPAPFHRTVPHVFAKNRVFLINIYFHYGCTDNTSILFSPSYYLLRCPVTKSSVFREWLISSGASQSDIFSVLTLIPLALYG